MMQDTLKYSLRTLLIVTACTVPLAGCSFPGVFRLDIQQGNIIEDKDLARVEPGMSRAQVHYVLGSPLSTDTFDPNIEDYVYTLQLSGGETHVQHVQMVYTDNNTLQTIRKRELLPEELRTLGKAYRARREAEKN
ncbi:MAG: outer membrane protein assembly factor BamE [Gammaproteobacteria bacterium]|nr:MAG: outer membrane protein assembly factor BamE [Gammaproteobacteria bacterium]